MRGDGIHKCEADLTPAARAPVARGGQSSTARATLPSGETPFKPSEWRADGSCGAGVATHLRCDRSQIQDAALAPAKSQMGGLGPGWRKGGPSFAPDFRIRDITGNERGKIRHPESVRLVGYIHFRYIEIAKSVVQGSLPPDEPTRITPANICAARE